jgi:hypothetical protein
MKQLTALSHVLAMIALAITMTISSNGHADELFSAYVDAHGNISLPSDFQTKWAFLGTWSVASKDAEQSGSASGHGAAALHNVYTPPGTIEAFRESGKFPDGSVLVKELLKTKTATMTTGEVSRGQELEGWFVMIKDTLNRFPGNTLWGDGWGWALFDANGKLTTKDYKVECLGCHIPAKNNDWVYVEGYPVLR